MNGSDNIQRAAAHMARYLSPETRKAFAAKTAESVGDDEGRPVSHHVLERLRKHLFEGTSSHTEAHTRMKALVEAHRSLYGGGEDESRRKV